MPHYFSLLGIVVMSILGFMLFPHDINFQTMIAIAAAFAYFTWGMVHHLVHKDLTFFVMLEYLVISIFGLSVILSLIYRR